MTITKDTLLSNLTPLSGSPDFSIALAFLRSGDTRQYNPAIAGKRAENRVVRPKDIITTWDTRLKNSMRRGFNLPGCADFVRRLKSLSNTTELVCLVFRNDSATGLFWFDRKTDEPIGFVISDRISVKK